MDKAISQNIKMTITSKITEITSIQQYPQMTIIFKNIQNNKNIDLKPLTNIPRV